MIQIEHKIDNPSGFHARPASMLVKEAMKHKADITFERGGRQVNCKSMMGVLAAGIKQGDEVVFTVSGEDESTAVESLRRFLVTELSGL